MLYSFVVFYVLRIQMFFCKSLGAFIWIGISLHFRCLFCLGFLWRILNPSNFKIQARIHPEWILFNHNISPNLKSNIIFQLIPSLKPYTHPTPGYVETVFKVNVTIIHPMADVLALLATPQVLPFGELGKSQRRALGPWDLISSNQIVQVHSPVMFETFKWLEYWNIF